MSREIEYSRILQPQSDGYDVQVYKDIKNTQGYTTVDYPSTMLHFHNAVAVIPRNEQDYNQIRSVDFRRIAELYAKWWPLGYKNFNSLIDAYIPNLEPNGNYSGQHDGVDFNHTGAWGIMSTLDVKNPAATFANLLHELMHWKLVTLGFGLRANTFFPTTQEFILNHESELCWSIVNSYADTAQPAVGNKPTDRPVSASLHAYLSFLGVAYTYSQVLRYEPTNSEAIFKMNRWGSRFDKCLDQLWKVGKFTDNGIQLMIGVTKWTEDFFHERRQLKV